VIRCVKTSGIYGIITLMDGVACISRRKVYYCVGRFEGGQTLTVDDVGPGRPSTATCIEVKEHIDQRVQA